MRADGRSDIVIISDLHMSAGYDARTGTFHRNEDFFYDGALRRFLDHLVAQGEREDRTWRLVILGDLVDFLQVLLPREPGAGATSHQATIERFRAIALGHPEVFAALAAFLRAGHRIDVLLGNHDIELIWPEVQAEFRVVLREHGASADDLDSRLAFHPWILYVPAVLYAEHGQQYDEINAFTTVITPFLPGQEDLIELPLGSFFVRYLFNHVEAIDPFADNVKPSTRYIGWVLRNHPVLGIATLSRYARFLVRSLPKTSSLSTDEQRVRRDAYRDRVIERAAAEIGLPVPTLRRIDELAAVPVLANRRRQLRALILRPLIPALSLAGAAAVLYRATAHLPGRGRRTVRGAGLLGAFLWRERHTLQPATDTNDYLLATARTIDDLLAETGDRVPVYVFGHTHKAAQSRLTSDDDSPTCFNSGTWTPIVPDSFSLLDSRERFTFVQLIHDADTGVIRSRIMRWDDSSGRAEPLPLLRSGESSGESFITSARIRVVRAMGG